LTIAMAEMYVQGVSTRKVKNILEKMWGLEVSSTQVSDAARKAVFPAVPWQRCYFHLSQNAQAYAMKIEEKKEIARTMRNIFSHDSKEDALMALRSAVQYRAETKKHPKFAGWLENNAEESMTYFNFNEGWWRKIRTSNCVERLNKEIKKRTKVAGVFPNPESCERLVGSLLTEQHDEWMEEKAYLTEKEMEISAFCA